MVPIEEHALRALGRDERDFGDAVSIACLKLMNKRVLIAGAAGAIGVPLTAKLRNFGISVVPTDIAPDNGPFGCERMDVTSLDECLHVVRFHNPSLVINLAAAKLAPAGEVNPFRAAEINAIGTHNLLCVAAPNVLLASTCKAVEPETAYGASKLIAERETLNAGGTVIRYVNVPECGPSMLTIWRDLPEDEPIPYTECTRYVITVREAVEGTILAAAAPPGRYKVDAGEAVHMLDYASRAFPGRVLSGIPLRRGDRVAEPYVGQHEQVESTNIPFFDRVVSYHD